MAVTHCSGNAGQQSWGGGPDSVRLGVRAGVWLWVRERVRVRLRVMVGVRATVRVRVIGAQAQGYSCGGAGLERQRPMALCK